MDALTQQNAAMAEQLAASARALKDQVETVLLSTRVFRLFKGEKTVSEMAVSRRLAGARYADKAVVTTKKHETRLAHEVGRTTKQHGEHVDHR